MPKISTIIVSVFIIGALVVVGWLAAVGTRETVPDINPPVAQPSYTGGWGGGGTPEPDPTTEMPPGAPEATALPLNYILFNITTSLMVNPISWDQPLTSHLNGAITAFDVEIHLFSTANGGAVETVHKINLLPGWFSQPTQNMRTESMINITVNGPNGFYVVWNSAYQYDYFMIALMEVHSHDWTTGRLFIFESGAYTAQLTFSGTAMPLSGATPPDYVLAYKEATFTVGG